MRSIFSFLATVACLMLLSASTALAQTTYYPARGVFNGYLAQTNIVECDNANSQAVSVVLTMRDGGGNLLAIHPFGLPAFGTVHTILNDLASINDRYGTYLLELGTGQSLLGDKVSCRTAFYRSAAPGSPKTFEYAYVLPVQNPQFGALTGIFNSVNPSQLATPTYNWLSVINFDPQPFNATVEIYGTNGVLDHSLLVSGLGTNARVDLPLGHPNGQISGTYRIVPTNTSQLYDAFLIRYNSKPDGNFAYAFPLRSLPGSCSGEPLNASTMGNGLTDNWLEIANTDSHALNVTIEVRNRNGDLLHTEDRNIPAYAQSHMFLSSIIDPPRTGNLGSARVICQDPNDKLIVQSAFYGHVPKSSTVEWSYAAQARGQTPAIFGAQLSFPVNTFLGMANWVKLADSSAAASSVGFNVYDAAGTVAASGGQALAAGGTADIGVHAMVNPNFVGSVVNKSDTATSSFDGEVLRVLSRSNDGNIGNIIQIPGVVQQAGVSGNSGTGFFGNPQSLSRYRDTLTREEATHLLNRAAYGGSQADADNITANGLKNEVDKLLTLADTTTLDTTASNWLDNDSDVDAPPYTNFSWQGIRRFWLTEMLGTPNPLRERMAFIWHDLFASSCRVISDDTNELIHCYEHLQLLRSQSLGNFRTLAQGMTVDYLMLVWLNGNQNRKGSPDENFAREWWELFSLGEKSKADGLIPLYSEADIGEAARAFTGWSTQYISGSPQQIFVQNNHDKGTKTLWAGTPYAISGNFTYSDVIDLTLDRRPESAQWIAKRLFTAFIHDHPDHNVINQISDMLRSNNFEIAPVVRALLSSEAMFSADARGARIKDPITYSIGFLRQTGIPMRIDNLENYLSTMGLTLLDPPDVNGWPVNKYKGAAKSDYFLAWAPQYANFVTSVLTQINQFPSFSLASLMPATNATADQVVDRIASVLDVQLTASERSTYVTYMNTKRNSNGTIANEVFNPAVTEQVRRKVGGVLWMMGQQESYMTY